MKRPLFLCITLCGYAMMIRGQAPYHLNPGRELVFGSSAVIMGGMARALSSSLDPLSSDAINALSTEELFSPDRLAVNYFSGAAYRRSNVGEGIPLGLAASSPLILPLINRDERGYLQEAMTLLVLCTEVNLVSATGTHLAKNGIRRPRPYLYNPDVSMELKQTRRGRQSFMSGHSTTSAANSFFLAKVFSDYFPESPLKPYVWAVASALPAWTSVERVLSGRHFPTDVIAGYGWGAVCGFLIPHLHRESRTESVRGIAITPVGIPFGTGLKLTMWF